MVGGGIHYSMFIWNGRLVQDVLEVVLRRLFDGALVTQLQMVEIVSASDSILLMLRSSDH